MEKLRIKCRGRIGKLNICISHAWGFSLDYAHIWDILPNGFAPPACSLIYYSHAKCQNVAWKRYIKWSSRRWFAALDAAFNDMQKYCSEDAIDASIKEASKVFWDSNTILLMCGHFTRVWRWLECVKLPEMFYLPRAHVLRHRVLQHLAAFGNYLVFRPRNILAKRSAFIYKSLK